MTGQSTTDEAAAARVAAYLDNVSHQFAAIEQEPSDVIAFAATLERGTAWLRMTDLRTLLADRQRLQERVAEPEAEREQRTIEWTAGHPYDDGRPGLCTHGNQGEHNARQMASHGDGWVVRCRDVSPWRDPEAADDGGDGR